MHKKDIAVGYACLECKKVFKKHKYTQDKFGNWEPIEYEVVCPQCSAIMYETGSAFKAPKVSDIKAWSKLRPLFESGYKFSPDFGSPFEELSVVKKALANVPKSEFQKPARKRSKNA
ncbi:hypothetical protein [Teredinibacter sp. KSP-S5-2]|uniref:hypothetical protein n=1 Tax=Teredinibacter sp. KSP-S5-2 TaxID=3034506 RepID=UPI00293507D8|nr:hypothetical protein [Teredinibacter sp. KSP-S5-2]WNO11275.1 hypothetical protein P5V12_08835 [Teredinibacter sp. KSP-S5-2]